MTAPRIPLFQRKGAPPPLAKPAIAIHIAPAKSGVQTPNSDTDGPGGDGQDAQDMPKDVTCPKCGCEFDAETGEIKNAGDYGGGDQGGLPAGLASALGGGGGT